MRRCHSWLVFLLAFVWAFVIVCSDDALVYADVGCQSSVTLSPMILDGTEEWSESNTDFVLQDSNTLRTRWGNRKEPSRTRLASSVMLMQCCALQLVPSKKYVVPLELNQHLNERIILNYLHRQDGDK